MPFPIEELLAKTPERLDLTDEADDRRAIGIADELLASAPSPGALDTLETELLGRPGTPLMLHLAVKLARSKQVISTLESPLHVDVVFAMYKEHRRIRRNSEDPHGEDFLVRKVQQLEWLFSGAQTSWQLWAVDDGCPERSGVIAREVVEQRLPDKPVRVLFLQDAIDRGLAPAAGLSATSDSQKGGSVLFGMWQAAQQQREGRHLVGFTGADLSTHLGQVGLLVEPLLSGEQIAAIGSRREPSSVVVKAGVRNSRGKLFIYLWKRLLKNLDDIIDTQCGFKAFQVDFIREAAATTDEKRFAVDLELLLQAELKRAHSITRVPVCWIDSEAASTTTDIQPYLPMLRSVAAMYRRYLRATPEADRFAELIQGLSEQEWQTLLLHIPERISSCEAAELARMTGISVQHLAHGAGRDVFRPFRDRMEAEQVAELAIRSFRRHYLMVLAGEDGLLPESDIEPVVELPDADTLDDSLADEGARSLEHAVVIKLNGGLGTSMGLRRAKSLLPVKDGLSFLDLIARQATRAGCPLILMNSFSTRADSLAALEEYPRPNGGLPPDFLQHKVPKVDAITLLPATHEDPELTWCPPGHGDLYTALVTSGTLDALLAAGRRYAFVSNSDNLGAVLDRRILGTFVTQKLPFLMEVADRTAADRKGGHLALQAGRLILREAAQCPPDDIATFQDTQRHRYFNTNNIWIDLVALQEHLTAAQGVFPMPLIRNAKTVDPRDPSSTPVYQLESAMGAAIGIFRGGAAIRVPRTRFAPVKTCSDLLRVRSDATTMTEDFCLVPSAQAVSSAVPVDLDPRYYKFVGQLDERFPHGPPSLRECESLTIRGDVRFGRGVRCTGHVTLEHAGEGQRVIADGALLAPGSPRGEPQ